MDNWFNFIWIGYECRVEKEAHFINPSESVCWVSILDSFYFVDYLIGINLELIWCRIDEIDEMLIKYGLYTLDGGFVMNMKMWLDGDMVSDWHDNELRVWLNIWLAGWDD